MTETIFASKNVEEFALKDVAAIFASLGAVIARFAKNFFLRYRPRDRSNDHRKN